MINVIKYVYITIRFDLRKVKSDWRRLNVTEFTPQFRIFCLEQGRWIGFQSMLWHTTICNSMIHLNGIDEIYLSVKSQHFFSFDNSLSLYLCNCKYTYNQWRSYICTIYLKRHRRLAQQTETSWLLYCNRYNVVYHSNRFGMSIQWIYSECHS